MRVQSALGCTLSTRPCITLKLLIISAALGVDLQKDLHDDGVQHHLEVVDHLLGESGHVAVGARLHSLYEALAEVQRFRG